MIINGMVGISPKLLLCAIYTYMQICFTEELVIFVKKELQKRGFYSRDFCKSSKRYVWGEQRNSVGNWMANLQRKPYSEIHAELYFTTAR